MGRAVRGLVDGWFEVGEARSLAYLEVVQLVLAAAPDAVVQAVAFANHADGLVGVVEVHTVCKPVRSWKQV